MEHLQVLSHRLGPVHLCCTCICLMAHAQTSLIIVGNRFSKHVFDARTANTVGKVLEFRHYWHKWDVRDIRLFYMKTKHSIHVLRFVSLNRVSSSILMLFHMRPEKKVARSQCVVGWFQTPFEPHLLRRTEKSVNRAQYVCARASSFVRRWWVLIFDAPPKGTDTYKMFTSKRRKWYE